MAACTGEGSGHCRALATGGKRGGGEEYEEESQDMRQGSGRNNSYGDVSRDMDFISSKENVLLFAECEERQHVACSQCEKGGDFWTDCQQVGCYGQKQEMQRKISPIKKEK